MKSSLTRRHLLMVFSGAALTSTGAAWAQESPLLKETDPGALSVGYAGDAAQVDRKKYPSYAPGQACASCALYGGDAGQAQGGCQLFIGVEVRAAGWCSSWEARPKS